MRIALVSSEAVPFAKTGGLADVAGTLFREFWHLGHDVVLFLPYYRAVKNRWGRSLSEACPSFSVQLGDSSVTCRALSLDKLPFANKAGRRPAGQRGQVVFIEHDAFFDRDELYATAEGAYPDNRDRFIFFAKAAVEAMQRCGPAFDVVHCHDWQTGLIPLYLKTLWSGAAAFFHTRSVFTIHNLGYQGLFPADSLPLTGLGWEHFTMDGIEFFGQVNLLKAGIVGADAITTVSRTYAREMLTPEQGFGLDGILRKRSEVLFGIVNGIDYAEWTPFTDPFIPSRYSSTHLTGKSWCRRTFVKEHPLGGGLDRPLLSFIGRLADQKGVDVLVEVIPALIEEEGCNVAIIGKGIARLQEAMAALKGRYPDAMHLTLGFDEKLAHSLYAASDIFLMPSQYEPCGLGQMIAMRYGTVPVARRTGGLTDTIEDGVTGFLFDDYSADAFLICIRSALAAWKDKRSWRLMVRAAMDQDFSWERSAKEYCRLYMDGRV